MRYIFNFLKCNLIYGIVRKIKSKINKSNIKLQVTLTLFFSFLICGCEDKKPQIPFSNISTSEIANIKVSFSNENNQILSVENFKNNVLIIGFSTTWCPNCPTTIKSLEKLDQYLKKENIYNVKIIIVNLENISLENSATHYKNIAETLKVYKIENAQIDCIKGVPACVVFDKTGKAVYGYLGANDFSSENFKNFVEYLSKHASL